MIEMSTFNEIWRKELTVCYNKEALTSLCLNQFV